MTIEPSKNLPLLSERPGIGIAPLHVRIGCRLAGPLVQRWLRRKRSVIEIRLLELMKESEQCRTRAELEQLLGPPQYALAGNGFARGDERPDSVETYAKDGCQIEIWFRDGKRWMASGCIHWTHWQFEMARLNWRVN